MMVRMESAEVHRWHDHQLCSWLRHGLEVYLVVCYHPLLHSSPDQSSSFSSSFFPNLPFLNSEVLRIPKWFGLCDTTLVPILTFGA